MTLQNPPPGLDSERDKSRFSRVHHLYLFLKTNYLYIHFLITYMVNRLICIHFFQAVLQANDWSVFGERPPEKANS
jgi:hypothetical protein